MLYTACLVLVALKFVLTQSNNGRPCAVAHQPPLKIAILGPPGVGKSYVSRLAVKELNLTLVSSGNLLRAEAAKDTGTVEIQHLKFEHDIRPC